MNLVVGLDESSVDGREIVLTEILFKTVDGDVHADLERQSFWPLLARGELSILSSINLAEVRGGGGIGEQGLNKESSSKESRSEFYHGGRSFER
jgi:hypothetical protein